MQQNYQINQCQPLNYRQVVDPPFFLAEQNKYVGNVSSSCKINSLKKKKKKKKSKLVTNDGSLGYFIS